MRSKKVYKSLVPRKIMIKTEIYDSIREVGKVLTGLALIAATLPLPILLARDIIQSGRYENDPNTIFYDTRKPTPNTEDFPEGRPKADSVNRYNTWLRKISFS